MRTIQEYLQDIDKADAEHSPSRRADLADALVDEIRSLYGDERLLELCTAEREKRVVVLPCKVGEKIYRIFNGKIDELLVENVLYESIYSRWKVFTIPYMCIYWEECFEKTIFLTREAAEKALEGMK
jgi:hypothetical protein